MEREGCRDWVFFAYITGCPSFCSMELNQVKREDHFLEPSEPPNLFDTLTLLHGKNTTGFHRSPFLRWGCPRWSRSATATWHLGQHHSRAAGTRGVASHLLLLVRPGAPSSFLLLVVRHLLLLAWHLFLVASLLLLVRHLLLVAMHLLLLAKGVRIAENPTNTLGH